VAHRTPPELPEAGEEAALRQRFRAPAVEPERAGLAGRGGQAVADDNVGSAETKFTGQHQADRTGTDHNYVSIHFPAFRDSLLLAIILGGQVPAVLRSIADFGRG
jgi:hypothetical protein